MDWNFNGKHEKFFKEHYEEIINYFCDGTPSKEISKHLKKKYHVNITYQAINGFYRKNQSKIDECIKERQKEKIDEFKEVIAIDYCKGHLKEFINELLKNMKEDISALQPKERMKYFIQAVNAMAKLDGLEKSEINVDASLKLEKLFDDDLVNEIIDGGNNGLSTEEQ